MKQSQLENLALGVIDRVKGGGKVEDARVELKREWPLDFGRAARRLAGHCNAARADWVVWIVGMSEDGTLRQGAEPETHEWVSALSKCFDGVAPSLMMDLKVPFGETHVTALLFDAQRRPYVWKASGEDGSAMAPIGLEVPWREGSMVRSARREELIRLLVPTAAAPAIELVRGDIQVHQQGSHDLGYTLEGQVVLYFSPHNEGRLVLPIHRMKAFLTSSHSPWVAYLDVTPPLPFHRAQPQGLVSTTGTEIIVTGPGSATLTLTAGGTPPIPENVISLVLTLTYGIAGDDAEHRYSIAFAQLVQDEGTNRWSAFKTAQ